MNGRGLTKADSIKVAAKRVAESPIQFECEYLQTIRYPGKNPKGTCDMIIGRVVEVHIADDVIMENGKLDIMKIQPIGRLGILIILLWILSSSMAIPVNDPRMLHF